MKGMKDVKLLVQQLKPSRYGREEVDGRRGTGDRSTTSVLVRNSWYFSCHICFLVFISFICALAFWREAPVRFLAES